MTKDDQADALRTIAKEAERLRAIAIRMDAAPLAGLLEQVLHEARAEIGKIGADPNPSAPADPKVTQFRPRQR